MGGGTFELEGTETQGCKTAENPERAQTLGRRNRSTLIGSDEQAENFLRFDTQVLSRSMEGESSDGGGPKKEIKVGSERKHSKPQPDQEPNGWASEENWWVEEWERMHTELEWLKFRNVALEKVEGENLVLREELEQEKLCRVSDQVKTKQRFQQLEIFLQGGLAHVLKQAGETMGKAIATERKKWEESNHATPSHMGDKEKAELEHAVISFVAASMGEWKGEMGREFENGLQQIKAGKQG